MILVRIARLAHPLDGHLDVVVGSPQIDVRAEERPVGAAAVLVGHSDTSCIHQPNAGDLSVELGMRVAADDDSFRNSGKSGGDPLLGGDRGQDLLVASRRSVAEKGLPEPIDVEGHARGEIAEETAVLRVQLVGDPGAGLAITVTAHPDGVVAESRMSERTSRGIGPATTSPPTTMRSTELAAASASTASRAGRFP